MLPRKNRPHVIELCGLPGTGKTTCARSLESEKEFLSNRIQKGIAVCMHPALFSKGFIHIIHESVRTGTARLVRYKISLLCNTLSQYHRVIQTGGILDEGFLQRILSLLEERRDTSDMKCLITSLPLGENIIMVEIQEATFQRYTKKHIRRMLGDAYFTEWKKVLKHNYITLKKALDELSIPYTVYNKKT